MCMTFALAAVAALRVAEIEAYVAANDFIEMPVESAKNDVLVERNRLDAHRAHVARVLRCVNRGESPELRFAP